MDGTFEEYVAARGDALLRFAYLLCADRHLAEDLVQEVLARIHDRWYRLTHVEQPDAYLRKAIVRQFLSWRRRRASREISLDRLPDRAGAAPDGAARHAARDDELPQFPFTPGLMPEASGEPYVVFDDPVITLVHPHVDGGEPVLTVHVEPPGSDVLAARLNLSSGIDIPAVATIRGNPVRLRGGSGGISWREESGLNVVIRSDRHPNAYDWVEYGEALIERPSPVTVPFRFDLVPAGAEPVLVQRHEVTLALAAAESGARTSGRLTLRLFNAADSAAWRRGPDRRWQEQAAPVGVGERPAELVDTGAGWLLYLQLADELVLHVTSVGQPELSRDDLLRFAAGVGLTPHARPHR